MVKISSMIITLLLLGSSFVFAGDKEELQLQEKLLQERMGRLQAEFVLSKNELADVQYRLNIIALKEKQEKDEKEKTSKAKKEEKK